MPIYEFKCMKCDDIFEILLLNTTEPMKLQCPKCHSEDIERVLSTAGYAMGSGSKAHRGVVSKTRTCPSGSCTTYDIPGPDK